MNERRRQPRLQVLRRATVQAGADPCDVTLVNTSGTGGFLACREVWAEGTRLTVTLGEDPVLHVEAIVVHAVERGGYPLPGLGVAWLTARGPHEPEALCGAVRSLLRAQGMTVTLDSQGSLATWTGVEQTVLDAPHAPHDLAALREATTDRVPRAASEALAVLVRPGSSAASQATPTDLPQLAGARKPSRPMRIFATPPPLDPVTQPVARQELPPPLQPAPTTQPARPTTRPSGRWRPPSAVVLHEEVPQTPEVPSLRTPPPAVPRLRSVLRQTAPQGLPRVTPADLESPTEARTSSREPAWPDGVPASLAERYGNLQRLGHGGLGVLYKARDRLLDRPVVLKFMAPAGLPQGTAGRYFEREVKLAASLNHVNIVHLYDVGRVEGVAYYAMEFVDGQSLSHHLPDGQPVTDAAFLRSVALQLAEALDHAHDRNVLHRDVKPDNVLVARDGTVKLCDFGLGRPIDRGFGEQSVQVGTAEYMAPEQMTGGAIDRRTDLYALGVLLYRMVAGRLPFADGNLYVAHATQPVPDPRTFRSELPEAAVAVLDRMLAKDPAQRQGSCKGAVEQLLEALAAGEPVP